MREMLPGVPVLGGDPAGGFEDTALLTELGVDYLLSVHFPYKFPSALLRAPAIGCLNLHPAWLPFNRGWHTPSWAIYEKTPYGATLHWIDAGIDSGDIAIRRRLDVKPSDTAHSLYQRVLQLEQALLSEAVPLMIEKRLPRLPQERGGSAHTKRQLQGIQRLDLTRTAPTEEILDRLRALTTNRRDEGAYFEIEGVRYYVRIEIEAEESPYES
ncbi:MAG: formyltransferase family protein [Gammaproteobacteria bacterium]